MLSRVLPGFVQIVLFRRSVLAAPVAEEAVKDEPLDETYQACHPDTRPGNDYFRARTFVHDDAVEMQGYSGE